MPASVLHCDQVSCCSSRCLFFVLFHFHICVWYIFIDAQFYLHGLQGWVMKVMPSFLVDKAVMSMHAGIRKRGLKKDARIAAEGKKE